MELGRETTLHTNARLSRAVVVSLLGIELQAQSQFPGPLWLSRHRHSNAMMPHLVPDPIQPSPDETVEAAGEFKMDELEDVLKPNPKNGACTCIHYTSEPFD